MIYSINEGIIFSTKRGREKVLDNYKLIRKSIESNIKMIEDAYPLLKSLIDIIESGNSDTENFNKGSKIVERLVKLDYDRGSESELAKMSLAYIKYRFHKVFNRADFNNKDVSKEFLEFEKDCYKDGKLGKKLLDLEGDYLKLVDRFREITESNNYSDNQAMMAIINRTAYELHFFLTQFNLTKSDISVVSRKAKKVELKESSIFESIKMI